MTARAGFMFPETREDLSEDRAERGDMPELPEVETIVRELTAARIVGGRILRARVYWPRIVAAPSAREFPRRLRGRRITAVSRRGKYIVLELSGPRLLLVHLRMSGQLCFARAKTPRAKHEHLTLWLDDGRELRYRDARKFGRWYLLEDAGRELGRLGPEPLSRALTGRLFSRRLARHKGMLKPLLLSQGFVAGLGNIYADEALWAARLHPRRRAASLDEHDRRRLYRAMRSVLRRAVQSMGTTLGTGLTNYRTLSGAYGRFKPRLMVFRRQGRPCPRCGATIERIVVGQRGTHVCPRCQPDVGT